MGRNARPFSRSVEAGFSERFLDSLHPHRLPLSSLVAGASFEAAAATAASDTLIGSGGAFSLRLTFDPAVEGATEVVMDWPEDMGRERHTSFISFSSNSVHRGTMWSRSSDQTIKTRSSRWI